MAKREMKTPIRRILVPLDASPFSEAAVTFACHMAKRHGACVSGLVVLDVPGIEKSIGPVPVGAMYYAERKVVGEEKRGLDQIHRLLERFEAKCAELGVMHTEAECQGIPTARIVAESHFYDCLVVGLQTYFRYGADAGMDGHYGTNDDRKYQSIEGILDHVTVPVWAVPMNWQPVETKTRILVAFDGKLPAVRALHFFAQSWFPEESEVMLLNSTNDPNQGRFLIDQAAAYLAAHGYQSVKKEVTNIDIRSAMERIYLELADLVVLGGHSKSMLLDFMVGSVCKDLILCRKKALMIAP